MKNKFLILLLAIFGLASCDDDKTEPPIVEPPVKEKDIQTFVFNGEYTAVDINLYTGPKGEKENLTVEELHGEKYEGLWNMKEPSKNTIVLNFEVDSVSCISEYSQIDYKMANRKDSVFGYHRGNGQEFFLGILDKEKTTLTLYRYCYLWIFMPRSDYDFYFSSKGGDYGIMEYEDNFFEDWFNSPTEMDKEGDLVLWANFKYAMKKKE